MNATLKSLGAAAAPWFMLAGLGCACSEAPTATGSVMAISGNKSTEAWVHFDGGVQRGPNVLNIELVSIGSDGGRLQLELVEAVMASHAHVARAEQISLTSDGFRAGPLDLFMSGRWQVELAIRSDSVTDSVSFPIDVP